MRLLHRTPLLILLLGVAGCTTVNIHAPTKHHEINHVLIRENPKVVVGQFLGVLRDGLDRHGISSEVIDPDEQVDDEEYVVTYTALQSWDLATYLSHAEIRIDRGGKVVASAEYHLRGKGGLSLLKWRGVRSKMDPVIDRLVDSLRRQSADQRESGNLSP